MNGGIWLKLMDAHLHPSFIALWHKCVPHHYVNKIGVHIHLSIAKCKLVNIELGGRVGVHIH
jgi:hypothetical protein